MMRRALLLLLLATSPAWAQQSKDAPASSQMQANKPDLAFGAYQRGYYMEAMREAQKRIAQDPRDGAAMTLIGELYRNGLGVNRSPEEAMRWYRRAAENGDMQGAFALALGLLRGDGAKPDPAAARTVLERVAQSGHAGALYELGMMDLEGELQNPARASDYFARAAALNNAEATYALGLLFKQGRGVSADRTKAAFLFRRAADLDLVAAQIEYAIMLFNGDGVEKDEAAAARLLQKAARIGNPLAANRLARLFATGRGVERNMVEAMKWHLTARSAGLKDEWLDTQLNTLSPAERRALEDALRRQGTP